MAKSDRIGHIASILYKGGAKGEEQIDDRSSGEPLRIIIGENAVPRGIEQLLYEMEVGEEREVEIEPELGFGLHQPEGLLWYTRNLVYNGANLVVGDVIACPNQDDKNDILPGRVVEATADLVRIDVNHPFAGKTLCYWVKLVELS